jgi:hypothetical protein
LQAEAEVAVESKRRKQAKVTPKSKVGIKIENYYRTLFEKILHFLLS